MNQDSAFSHYTQLLDKIDHMFAAIRHRHADSFQCRAGCYGCCKSGLSVTHVEAARISQWISEHPDVLERIKSRTGMLEDENFCHFLSAEGHCMIYDARPLICRSHGMPISWVEESQESRDCCPLNFQTFDLDELDHADVLSLDKVNRLLSLIDREFDPAKAGTRTIIKDLVDFT